MKRGRRERGRKQARGQSERSRKHKGILEKKRGVFLPKTLRSISYKVTTTTQQLSSGETVVLSVLEYRGEKSNYRFFLRIGSLFLSLSLSLSSPIAFLPVSIWLIAYLRVAYITYMVIMVCRFGRFFTAFFSPPKLNPLIDAASEF